jgi:hypothetical protein
VAVLKGAHEHGLAKGSAGRPGHGGYGGGQSRTTAGRGGTAARGSAAFPPFEAPWGTGQPG